MAPSDETAKRVRALGIRAPLGKHFTCVIPGHVGHRAHVAPTRHGFWHYYCPALPSQGIGLAEVRASQAYGGVGPLSGVLTARWNDLLDYEAGLVKPVAVPMKGTDGLDPTTQRVAQRLRLFLGLRGAAWRGQPFTFARSFVIAYCRVTNGEARRAMRVMEASGVIRRYGLTQPYAPILWTLGNGKPVDRRKTP